MNAQDRFAILNDFIGPIPFCPALHPMVVTSRTAQNVPPGHLMQPFAPFPLALSFVSSSNTLALRASMSARFTIALILSILYLSTPAWADYQAGTEAFERGDYATALPELRPFAEHGDSLAQSMLGWMYEWGEGVPKDYMQARVWYEKAAAQGFAPAQTNLGALYNIGRGVPQDYVQARLWYEKAAAKGFAPAKTRLGRLENNERGVPKA